MAIKSIGELKRWFKTGQIPTGANFSDLIDSLRHKNEKIDITEVENLSTVLNQKCNISLERTVSNHSAQLQALQNVAWGGGDLRLMPTFDGIDDGEGLNIDFSIGYNGADEVVYLSRYGMFASRVQTVPYSEGMTRVVGGYTQTVYYPVFANDSRRDSDYQSRSGDSITILGTKLFRLSGSDELWMWDSERGALVRASKVQAKDLNVDVSLIVIDGMLHVRASRELQEGESIWLMRNGKWASEKRIRNYDKIENGVGTIRKGWRRYKRSNHENASYGIDMPFTVTLQSKPLHGRDLVGSGGPQYWLYRIEMPADVLVESFAYTDTKANKGVWLCVRNGKKRKELDLRKYDSEGNRLKQSVSMLYGVAIFRETQEAEKKVYSERVSNIAPYRVEVRDYKYDTDGKLWRLRDFRLAGDLAGYCQYRVE